MCSVWLSRESASTKFQDFEGIQEVSRAENLHWEFQDVETKSKKRCETVACFPEKGVLGALPLMEMPLDKLDKVLVFRREQLQRRLNTKLMCIVVFFL